MSPPAPSETNSPPTLIIEGRRASIWLNRPGKHNRIEFEDLAILAGILNIIDSERDIRVVVLSATGPTFCSGFNIGEITTTTEKSAVGALCDALENLRVPTIAALNGAVHGGGAELALACDFRLGVTATSLRIAAALIGLQYDGHGLRRYVSRLGLTATKRLFLMAQQIDSAEMVRIGYLDEIVSSEQLSVRAGELADLLSQMAPHAVSGMKSVLNSIARGTYDEAAALAGHLASRASTDFAEGIAAWREKRMPEFGSR